MNKYIEWEKQRRLFPNKFLQEVYSNDYTTINTTLKTVLHNYKDVQPVIANLVFEINDLMFHTYQFIRMYCYNNNQHIPKINKIFILNCIKILCETINTEIKERDISILQDFYDTKYQPLFNHEKTNMKNKSNMLSYLAIQLHTLLYNNTQKHFIRYFLHFISKTTTHITEDKLILIKFKKQLLNCDNDTDNLFDEWKIANLSHILPTNLNKSIHYDVKIRPFEYLKGMFYMNLILDKQKHTIFQPIDNIISTSIMLDTTSIVNIFHLEDKIDTELFKKFKNYHYEVWNTLLNLQHKFFTDKHYQFHYQIQTDGINCSLSFIRKDIKYKKWKYNVPNLEERYFHNIEDLSLKPRYDPEKRNLVYMCIAGFRIALNVILYIYTINIFFTYMHHNLSVR